MNKYTQNVIKKHIELACKGFIMSIIVQNIEQDEIIIHTGNWGSGAFNHNFITICMIQLVAFNMAVTYINTSLTTVKNIQLIYNTYDEETSNIINQYKNLIIPILSPKCDLNTCVNTIYNTINGKADLILKR
jgi:hypothetical protein